MDDELSIYKGTPEDRVPADYAYDPSTGRFIDRVTDQPVDMPAKVYIQADTVEAFEHLGFNCFVYKWSNGKWGSNVDGMGDPAQWGTEEEAIQAAKDNVDWIKLTTGDFKY